jgi:hypothetical protein
MALNNWLEKLLRLFRRGNQTGRRPQSAVDQTDSTMAALDAKQIGELVKGVLTTRPDEIGCDDCFEQLDHFAELHLAGKDAAAALPLVQDHLERCQDCREEFTALLLALQAADEAAA